MCIAWINSTYDYVFIDLIIKSSLRRGRCFLKSKMSVETGLIAYSNLHWAENLGRTYPVCVKRIPLIPPATLFMSLDTSLDSIDSFFLIRPVGVLWASQLPLPPWPPCFLFLPFSLLIPSGHLRWGDEVCLSLHSSIHSISIECLAHAGILLGSGKHGELDGPGELGKWAEIQRMRRGAQVKGKGGDRENSNHVTGVPFTPGHEEQEKCYIFYFSNFQITPVWVPLYHGLCGV